MIPSVERLTAWGAEAAVSLTSEGRQWRVETAYNVSPGTTEFLREVIATRGKR
jgi:hypothetical protein